MTNFLDDIKDIIFNFIETEYKNYLQENKILLIKEENIKNVIKNFYEINLNKIKGIIRKELKNKYKDEYSSSIVENIILDIFQDKNLNIDRVSEEFISIQKKNKKEIILPIINNSLNLNISLADNFVIINSTNPKKIEDSSLNELYETINNYKFLYSIDDFIIESTNEKINKIKEIIQNKENIKIEVYYLKN